MSRQTSLRQDPKGRRGRDVRGRWLEAWGRGVTRHPIATLLVCGLIAAGSVLLAVNGLKLNSDRSDLVDPSRDWNARYAIYREDFPRWDDLLICIAGDPDDHALDDLARSLAEDLGERSRVQSADAGFQASSAGPRMYLTAPTPQFHEALTQLVHGGRLAGATTPTAALETLFAMAQESDAGGGSIADLATFVDPLLAGIRGEAVRFDLIGAAEDHWQPLATSTGRLRFIMVSLVPADSAGVEGIGRDLTWLRTTVGDLLRARGLTGIDWGITGISAMEADETDQAIKDSTIASIVAFVLVTALLLLVFARPMLPLLAAVSLSVGIAWSFAWVVISVGHLQLLSIIFSAILVGLGVDFALHLIARLRLVELEHPDLESAMGRTFRDVGPGLVTGAITTAAAFGCTAFTAFKGVAEMGIIASGGVLLCLVAVMSVFPALLALVPRWRHKLRRIRSVSDHGFPQMVAPFQRHPGWTLGIGGLVGLGFIVAAMQVRYDPNLLNLQPPGLESVQWAKRLANEPGSDLWSGLIMTTPEAAPALVAALRSRDEVDEVTGMGVLYPQDLQARLDAVAQEGERLQDVSQATDRPTTLVTQLRLLANGLRRELADMGQGDRAVAESLVQRIEPALADWASIAPAERRHRYEAISSGWQREATTARDWFRAALTPNPPTAEDLPSLLRSLWIGRDGQWLLRVAPIVEDASVLDPIRLGAFVEDVRVVAPDLLGTPVQVYESTILIIDAYVWAAVMAVVAILVVLLVDFRNPMDVFSAMLPVLLGFVGTFALMAIFGLPVNFANLMVMPMILGIGVDAGVHAVHRWRSDPFQKPAGLWGGTGQGIAITLATTGIAFASLLVADHRAVKSLAIVMVIGLTVTFIATVTVLPALLGLRSNLQVRRD